MNDQFIDYEILGIFGLLVWTGALFFGYPIGKLVGRRQTRREFEIIEQKDGDDARRRAENENILNAEVIE